MNWSQKKKKKKKEKERATGPDVMTTSSSDQDVKSQSLEAGPVNPDHWGCFHLVTDIIRPHEGSGEFKDSFLSGSYTRLCVCVCVSVCVCVCVGVCVCAVIAERSESCHSRMMKMTLTWIYHCGSSPIHGGVRLSAHLTLTSAAADLNSAGAGRYSQPFPLTSNISTVSFNPTMGLQHYIKTTFFFSFCMCALLHDG